MSSTFSDLAATSLLRELAKAPSSGRHLVTAVPGGDLPGLFRAVLSRAETSRWFPVGNSGAAELQVVGCDGGTVILPYLVIEPPPPDPRANRGGQGFIGAIRDRFEDAAADDERIQLLTFDARPNETELTTMDQGVTATALSLDRILALALAPPDGAAQPIRRVLSALAPIAMKEPARLTPEMVAETALGVARLARLEAAADVAHELHALPWCLKDLDVFEYAGNDLRRRLEAAADLRVRLTGWASDPNTDFDASVRSRYTEELAERIRAARHGNRIDWSRFTFGELQASEPPTPDEPLAFAALPIEIAEATTTKLLPAGTVAAHVPGPGATLTFRLSGPLTGKATIHVSGFSGDRPPYTRKPLAQLSAQDATSSTVTWRADELPQPRSGWSFLEVVLTRGARLTKTRLGEFTLALRIDPDESLLIYEASGNVDLDEQAYVGAEDLTFIGEKDGEETFAEAVEPADDGALTPVAERWEVPALQIESPDDDPDEAVPTESPLHLAIEAWYGGELLPGPLTPRIRTRPDGAVMADVGVKQSPIEVGTSMPLSRWELERHIIAHPRTTTFEVAAGQIRPAAAVEALQLGVLDDLFRRFLEARSAFFAELDGLRFASVLAADLTKSAAASQYVDRYTDLLQAVPDGQAGELGYDKILLTDAVLVEETGEVLFAPTSPLSVAAQTQLGHLVADWLSQEPGSNYFPGDAGAISPRNLVPFLRLHHGSAEWLESGYAPYPWRRYLPLSRRNEQQRPPSLQRYIARRVERFLDVHPTYRDERRTLRLAFINPGTGAHVRDALLSLAEPLARGKKHPGLPSFELQLLADDTAGGNEVLGADLDLFMSLTPEAGQPSEAAVEVMRRLSYTKGSAAAFLNDPKAFAHLTFVENFFRPQPDLVEWDRSAHPTSNYVDGLAAETERLARIEPAGTRFLTSTWTGTSGEEPLPALAGRITEIAASAAGVPVKRGITRAADVRVPNSVIPQLYDRSVWVVHIDRHIGLELFYPQNLGTGAPYILDYTDQETPDPGIFDGITATHQVEPYHARIGSLLGAITGAPLDPAATERLLRTLNLISGRWGIEMLRTDDNTLRGRLATVIAAQALEHAEQFHDDAGSVTIVIALDELLRASGGEGLAVKAGWLAKLRRTGGGSDDLFVLTIPVGEGRPKLRGRIIEVKYRSTIGTSADEAAEQIAKTHELLRDVFCSTELPGRLFQGRHLAKLILRYTGRHRCYGVGSENPAIIRATEAISRIALGDYDLNLEIPSSDGPLLGDFVSVEPKLTEAVLERHVHQTDAGIAIGRIRMGLPVIRRLLGTAELASPGSLIVERDIADVIVDGASHAEASAVDLGSDEHEAASAGSDRPRYSETDGGPGEREGAGPTITSRGTEHVSAPEEATADSRASAAPEPAASPFDVDPALLRGQASRLDDVLTSYKLPLQPVEAANAVCGPNVIRFRVRMARGGTIAQLEARERDIMRELGLDRPVMIDQDAGFVTLDVPRTDPVTVEFAELAPVLDQQPARRGELPVLFGVDVAGTPRVENLAALPHLLVAGTTGAGKSVFLSSLLASLARLPPEHVEIVLVDVKGLDFAPFRDLPHLRQPPIDEAEVALTTLENLYETERARRRRVLADAGAQSVLDYYDRLGGTELKQVVVVIDEFSNLLTGDKATGSQLEDVVQKYAEIMRSFGVYLVIATQRPSADIVTGRIKANLPARCAFRLPTHVDSMTILGRKGAEQLLGRGDMLFYRDGAVERLQAALTTAQDVLGAAAPA